MFLNRKPTSRVYRGKIEGEEEAHLIALCCSHPPEGYAHWTMQMLADKMVELEYVECISDESVRQVLKRNELKPWQKRVVYPSRSQCRFCLSNGRSLKHLHPALRPESTCGLRG